MKELIIEFLPTILLALETIYSFLFIFRKIKRLDVERDVRKATKKLEDRLDVLLSDNAELRRENITLLNALSKRGNNDRVHKETKD